VFNKMGNI